MMPFVGPASHAGLTHEDETGEENAFHRYHCAQQRKRGRNELPGDAREVFPKYPQDEEAEMQDDKGKAADPRSDFDLRFGRRPSSCKKRKLRFIQARFNRPAKLEAYAVSDVRLIPENAWIQTGYAVASVDVGTGMKVPNSLRIATTSHFEGI